MDAGAPFQHGIPPDQPEIALAREARQWSVMEQSGDGSRVLRANGILLTWDGNQICALVGPDLVEGVAGFGDGVHDALRDLADNLVREGVWIEVTNRTEWDIRETSD